MLALLDRAAYLIRDEHLQQLTDHPADNKFSATQVVYFGNYLRYRFKNATQELIDIYGRLDAWYGMAAAVKRFGLVFPHSDTVGKAIY